MNKFKLSLLTMAMATVGISHFGAYALESDTEAERLSPTEARERAREKAELEVIEIRGFRRSVVESINTKRFSTNVVEAISAEDIGKLPDSSIAESIARLPGLTAQRLDGRASRVSIRGFGENESATTFNGREQVSIGDNRGVEFDLYPSEIMSGVTVYKTPGAMLEAEGIAGVIDLQTVRPLNRERTVQVNGQMEKSGHSKLNPDGNDTGFRGTFSYIDQFADDRVGIAFAYTKMNSPNQEKRWNAWGYPDFEVDGQQYAILGGAKPFVRSSTLKRDSAMLVVEALPTDNLKLVFDALYVDFSDEKILRGIEIPFAWGYGRGTSAQEIDPATGFVTRGSVSDEYLVVRNDLETRDAKLKSFGLNLDYTLNDNWTLNFDVSHSSVDRTIWSFESYAGTGRGDNFGVGDNLSYELRQGNSGAVFTPTLDYSDFNLIQLGGPRSWGWSSALNDKYGLEDGNPLQNTAQDGFLNTPTVDDELNAFRLAASQMLDNGGIITQMHYGVSYRERTKEKFSDGFYMTLRNFPDTLVVPQEYRLGSVNLDFIGMGNMIAYDSGRMLRDGYYDLLSERLTNDSHSFKTWKVSEDVLSFFTQADLEMELGTIPVTGNIGLRYIRTEQSSQGTAFGNEGGLIVSSPTDVKHSYSHLLPSLNLIFDVAENQSVRFGAAKTMSRARLDEMNASVGATYNQQPDDNGNFWSIGGGNPLLEPKEAIGLDLSYENYFSDAGYFAIAYFWKDLKNWIFDGTYQVELDGVADPSTGQIPPTSTATGFGKVNGGGGTLQGLEFSVSLPLGELSDALDGFGLLASYTVIDQNVKMPNGNAYELPGLSKNIQSYTVFYEKNGFQARVSARIRSSFKGDVYGLGFDTQQVDINGETIVDAQIGFDFGEAGFDKLDGLSIFLQGQNLTNEAFVTTEGNALRIRDYQDYGRNFLLGFSYKF
ncbi:TonB-dependent receptor [Alkalimonas amylolytica]|uniref:Iron complex outermembrane recepter protein n=1 Tax=Alkalimonas amylolytica TaxID=152573 RepID=A0A1H4D781_ALKAM|nr:TonB-dependent receptor [Alkalimonas amylolytica]SEA68615.1 iron complex outermembrane recepter protein [Alkalimonas amylolytica]